MVPVAVCGGNTFNLVFKGCVSGNQGIFHLVY